MTELSQGIAVFKHQKGSKDMTELARTHFSWKSLLRPSVLLGLATLALHLAAGGGYGFFRDELYFIVCGQRLAWGYVDQPPIVPLLSSLMWTISGGSHFIFSLFPAVVMALTVAVTAEFARSLGGGRFAQFLAALCVFGAVVLLANGTLFSTETLQPLLWLGCSWCIVRIVKTGNEKWWLVFGAIAGISFLNKYLIGLYLVGILVGMLATPLRKSFLRPWLWAALALALAIIAPNVVWQYRHGWPFVELAGAAVGWKNVALSPLAYLGQQVLLAGPLALPVWLAGLWAFGIKPKHAAYRTFAVCYVVMFALAVTMHGKSYFLGGIYPLMFAGGAVWLESKVRSTAVRAIYSGVCAYAVLVFAPVTVPLLPVTSYLAYAKFLHVSPSEGASEHMSSGVLPQYYADKFGWKEMAEKVAAVYNALPPEQRAKAVFFGRNYGEAAAIDIFGRPLGLPPAISGHNSYYLWGPMGHDGSVVIVLTNELKELNAAYQEVTVAGRLDNPYAMPYETNISIVVASGLKVPFSWERLKHYE
ncbi:MAG TPA: glycosyltransferase family 39 protein [Spirochaetia bacterium]|nr:glycosyltransferase family 39 protein [Spirochaetia bacterium]